MRGAYLPEFVVTVLAVEGITGSVIMRQHLSVTNWTPKRSSSATNPTSRAMARVDRPQVTTTATPGC
jgi:hypothetical protein